MTIALSNGTQAIPVVKKPDATETPAQARHYDRDAYAYHEYYTVGRTYRDIGQDLGITGQRASALVWRFQRDVVRKLYKHYADTLTMQGIKPISRFAFVESLYHHPSRVPFGALYGC